MGVIDPGPLHRVALAVEDVVAATDWLTTVLGATAIDMDRDVDRHPGDLGLARQGDLEGADVHLLRLGGHPFVLLSKGVAGGPIAKFLERHGPGVHSLAWEVEDMWSVQNLLIERGIRIAAVNVPGRHFFMHPRDTCGVLMEWTDDRIIDRRDDRPSAIAVEGLAWVAAVVTDTAAAATFLVDLVGARPVLRNPTGPQDREATIDLMVGNVTLRLVQPLSSESPYADIDGSPRLCSYALRVGNLDTCVTQLEGLGIQVTHLSEGLVTTDPSATLGIPIHWTA